MENKSPKRDKKEKKANLTLLGKYLKSIDARPSKIEKIVSIPAKNITLLSTNNSRIIYGEDFYKIIVAAHHIAGIPEEKFVVAVEQVFPDRVKTNLMEDYKDYSSEGKFFKKHTQQQSEIEAKLGYSKNQLSKYFNDNTKRGLATDVIAFIEAMEMDILEVFKKIYGEINLVQNNQAADNNE